MIKNREKNANSSAYWKEPVVDGEAEIVVVKLDERLPQVSWPAKACCKLVSLYKKMLNYVGTAYFSAPLLYGPIYYSLLKVLSIKMDLEDNGTNKAVGRLFFYIMQDSVPDPEVFGPPGSGSFHHQAK